MQTHKKVVLKYAATGKITEDIFEYSESPLQVQLKPKQVLIQVHWVSIDPSMRIWITGQKSYIEPVLPGQTMRSAGVGTVIESASQKFVPGDLVFGGLGWQNYSIGVEKFLEKLPPTPHPQQYLGILGYSGMTAYFGFYDMVGDIRGKTVVVSSAAGSVGCIVVQLAKYKGAYVVALAGSDEKCAWVVNELGADYCINYKKTQNMSRTLRNQCPNGIDIYFDMVGGATLDAVLLRINMGGTILSCGSASGYDTDDPEPVFNYSIIAAKALTMTGFIVLDYQDRYEEGRKLLSELMSTGRMSYREHVMVGLENASKALIANLAGENIGKSLVKVDDL